MYVIVSNLDRQLSLILDVHFAKERNWIFILKNSRFRLEYFKPYLVKKNWNWLPHTEFFVTNCCLLCANYTAYSFCYTASFFAAKSRLGPTQFLSYTHVQRCGFSYCAEEASSSPNVLNLGALEVLEKHVTMQTRHDEAWSIPSFEKEMAFRVGLKTWGGNE
jgi:hypothetical protein